MPDPLIPTVNNDCPTSMIRGAMRAVALSLAFFAPSPPPPDSGATVFVRDSFTDTGGTDLSAHTSDSGSTWSLVSGYTGDAVITAQGRLRTSSSAASVWLASQTPAAASYDVGTDIYAYSFLLNEYGVGVAGRFNAAANSGYVAFYDAKVTSWYLQRIDNGTGTNLGTPYSQTISYNTTYRLSLGCHGSTISLSVNGTVLISVTDSTYQAAGSAGVYFSTTNVTGNGDTAGVQIDNFQGQNQTLFPPAPAIAAVLPASPVRSHASHTWWTPPPNDAGAGLATTPARGVEFAELPRTSGQSPGHPYFTPPPHDAGGNPKLAQIQAAQPLPSSGLSPSHQWQFPPPNDAGPSPPLHPSWSDPPRTSTAQPAQAWYSSPPHDQGVWADLPGSPGDWSWPPSTSGLSPSHQWFAAPPHDQGLLVAQPPEHPYFASPRPSSGLSPSHVWLSAPPLDIGLGTPVAPVSSQPSPSSGLSPAHRWSQSPPLDAGMVIAQPLYPPHWLPFPSQGMPPAIQDTYWKVPPKDAGAYPALPPGHPFESQPRPSSGLSTAHQWYFFGAEEPGFPCNLPIGWRSQPVPSSGLSPSHQWFAAANRLEPGFPPGLPDIWAAQQPGGTGLSPGHQWFAACPLETGPLPAGRTIAAPLPSSGLSPSHVWFAAASLPQSSPLSLQPVQSQPAATWGLNQGQIDLWCFAPPPDYGNAPLPGRVEAIRTTQGNGLSPSHDWFPPNPQDGGAYPAAQLQASQPRPSSGLSTAHQWYSPSTRDTGSLAILAGLSPLACQPPSSSGLSPGHRWSQSPPLDGGVYPPATPILSQPVPSCGLSPGHWWISYVPMDAGQVYWPLRDATSLVIETSQVFPAAEHGRATLI